MIFNKTFLNNDLLPKYTIFKLHNPTVYAENTTKKFRKHFSERQVTLSKNVSQEIHIEVTRSMESLINMTFEAQQSEIQHILSEILPDNDLQHKFKIENNIYYTPKPSWLTKSRRI